MPSIKSPLDQSLYDIVMEHLAKLADYLPGPVKKAGGTRDHLMRRYREILFTASSGSILPNISGLRWLAAPLRASTGS